MVYVRVAFVGSRDYKNIPLIGKYVRRLKNNVLIVSGGAIGVDQAAVRYAKEAGLKTKEHFPVLNKDMTYIDRVNAYYSRNKLIALDSSYVIAFSDRTNKGGTWNTISHAIKADIPVLVVRSTGQELFINEPIMKSMYKII